MEGSPAGTSGLLRQRWPEVVLAALMAVSGALLLAFRSRLGFMLDDWSFVIDRNGGGAGDFLDPHDEHISVIPVAIYKIFLTVFGVGHPMPLQVLSVAIFLASVLLLFLYLRTLVGEPVSVIGCAIILFFGFASEDLLWAFQIGFSLSMASGIGALLMLRRNDDAGDRWACALLMASILSTSLGLPFLVGSAVEILLRRERILRRAPVVLLPALVFLVWYLGWGHEAPSSISVTNALDSPEYVYNAFKTALSGLTGAFDIGGAAGSPLVDAIPPLLLAGTAAYLVVKRRLPRPLVVAAAIALTFWGLAALNMAPGRSFEASRYQYPGAVFILMMLAGAFEGSRPRTRVLVVVGLVAAFSVFVNAQSLRTNYRDTFNPRQEKGLAGLTALELARERVDPGFEVGLNESERLRVTAGDYFDAEDRYGSAGWDESGIAGESPLARARIDDVLIEALPVTAGPVPSMDTSSACRTVSAVAAPNEAGETVQVAGGSFVIRPDADGLLTLGRFATGAPTVVTVIEAGAATLVRIPGDRSEVPWRAGFAGAGSAKICPSDHPGGASG